MATTDGTKAVVDAYYQAGVRGELPSFAPYLAADFSVTAPNYLPWGGTHVGAAYYDTNVLHHLPETLDFGRFSYDSFISEGNHAVALITIGVTSTTDTVQISEHWKVNDGLAQSVWVAYFEPQAVLAQLQINHLLTPDAMPTAPKADAE
jgi:ketosteroid isomerase-like protein